MVRRERAGMKPGQPLRVSSNQKQLLARASTASRSSGQPVQRGSGGSTLPSVTLCAMLHPVSGCAVPTPAAIQVATPALCWVEFGHGEAPGAFSATGATSKHWNTTGSGIVVQHMTGSLPVDAGWSSTVQQEIAEVSAAKRPTLERSFGTFKDC